MSSSSFRGAAVRIITASGIRRAPAGDSSTGDALLPTDSSAAASSKWWNPSKDIHHSLQLLTSSYLNILLLFVPLGIISEHLGWGASPTFLLNLFGLIPLALLLGQVTEDLAVRLGDVVGGLLNATFGNVVELILSISALQKGLYEVVSTSLLGSILSNLLLVLGFCFFIGGLRYKVQTFSVAASQVSTSLLFLSAISILMPTAAQHLGLADGTIGMGEDKVLLMSRLTAVALLLVYVAYLLFQLGTHAEMFSGISGNDEDGGEEHEPLLTLTAAASWLLGITLLVAVSSEYLTGSIEEVSGTWGLSQAFLGFIVLPIAGNACEHITAVFVSWKNKMDLALGVAIGSTLQIGLFVIPFVTLVGWATGHPFSLGFDPFAALVLLLSVLHANFMLNDAESHWLEGLQLLVTYVIIAIAYALN